MIVSWNWLADYLEIDDLDPADVEHRLAMAGLNHESSARVVDDLAIDLEVTSNRPDCLGHIGIAREIGVLWDRPLSVPDPTPPESDSSVQQLTKVTLECPELCYRYTARVLRGIQVGPSPPWLANRLRTLGIAVINNVVDITNYVLMESGQPLHAFDLDLLADREIIVRQAGKDEPFEAIDHKNYVLQPGMCVIADSRRPVAVGGVMGGADTEVSERTTDLLIESAQFAPLAIRGTARALRLHSPSSYRFERGVDSKGVDWASLRACEMILDLAGGELASGVIDAVGRPPAEPPRVVLRLGQLKRVLGIQLDRAEVRRILTALGNQEFAADAESVTVIPPSWRRDLAREIDLVEEIARIHGYDEIPEDVGVRMVPSHRSDEDRVLAKVRHVLTAAGFDEAITPSVVDDECSAAFSPWTDEPPVTCSTPMLRGADRLRRSLVPSLLVARRTNESLANQVIDLFETARAYLPTPAGRPHEEWLLTVASGRDFQQLKGVLENVVAALNPAAQLLAEKASLDLLDPVQSCQLLLDGQRCGYLGVVRPEALKAFGLRTAATVAEVRLAALVGIAQLVPQYRELSPYPSISYDVNLIVPEKVRWADLATTVRQSGGPHLERLEYRETYRNPQKDGPDKKRLLFALTLRSAERTLTGEQAESIRDKIVDACQSHHQAVLLA